MESGISPILTSLSNSDLGLVIAKSSSVLLWVSNTNKECVYFNEAWLNYRGRTLEQEYGNGWLEGVHHDDMERCMNIYTTAFDARESFSMDYRILIADGFLWVDAR
ncbi:PAS domain-containing protein [Aliiglaciecola sp.]|nr:PAS domain-containing protein [Aliiglaciecola sp.]